MDLLALNEEIEKSGKTKEYLAKVLNITRYSIYNKLSGATEFKASEMTLLAEELNLSIRKKNEIFFGKKSEYNSQKDLSVSPSYLAGWNEGEKGERKIE